MRKTPVNVGNTLSTERAAGTAIPGHFLNLTKKGVGIMKILCRFARRTSFNVWVFVATMILTLLWIGLLARVAGAEDEPQFTTRFRLEDCRFRTTGANPHFILKPGYRLVLEGDDGGEEVRVVKTVLSKTQNIFLPGIGKVQTRVIEEREYKDGELIEVSKNFFAICDKTNDVYYFGEDVDIFLPDGTISHDGAWRAGVNGAVPGIMMPGTFLLGARYFQEQAPGVAMDQAEHVEMELEVITEAGTFEDCVRIIETTPLEPGAESEKIYCPGVGQVVDNVVRLVEYGFISRDD